jgi:pilus assembly protein CpaE
VSLAEARFLVVLADGVDESPIRAALPSAAPLWVTDARQTAASGARMVEEVAPDVIVVGASMHSDAVLELIRNLSSRFTDYPIIVLYEGNPNGFMDPAFDAGADDLIKLPQSPDQVAFAIEKVLARRRGPADLASPAPMIAILGPKGGTGKTLTACNLGAALTKAGKRPVIVDLDLQFGDVGLALGLKPDRTIYDLVTAGGTLDPGKVDSFLMEHESGLKVLLAPVRPDEAAVVDVAFLRRLFEMLRSRYDFVIVDSPPGFTAEVIAAIDNASHLCMVGMLDALSLKDTKVGFETLSRMGYDPAKTALILNRADSNVGIRMDDVSVLLGRAPDVLVPSDRAIPRSITAGQAIVDTDPRSGAARAFTQLADYYLDKARAAAMEASHPGPEPARRGLRGLLTKGA